MLDHLEVDLDAELVRGLLWTPQTLQGHTCRPASLAAWASDTTSATRDEGARRQVKGPDFGWNQAR